MNNATTADQTRAKLLASIDRATARAIQQAEAGVRPILRKSEPSRDGLQTLQRWVVPSRTEADTFHVVTLICDCDGLRTECTCPAGQAETPKPCWHRALARRCALKEAPYTDARQPTVVIGKAELHGRPTRGVVLVDSTGNGTAPDPWPTAPAIEITRARKADAQGWYETLRCGNRQVTIRPRNIGVGDQAIYFDHEAGQRVKVEYGQAGQLAAEAEAWLLGGEQATDAPLDDAEAYAAAV